MRLKIHISTNKLPILYRHRFMALIKEALRISAPEEKNYLYPDKNLNKEITKPFTFCVQMPKNRQIRKEKFSVDIDFHVEDTVFYFDENEHLSMILSTCDPKNLINIYNGLLSLETFQFNDEIILHIDRFFLMNEKKIDSDTVMFKTLSPILIEDKNDRPILPICIINRDMVSFGNFVDTDESNFEFHFNAVHDRILKDIRGRGLKREIKFLPGKLKKQVVKHTLKGFREKTRKPYMTLTCFEGSFKLIGDPEDLQILYSIGIGLRTGQGFGMVEVV